MRHATLTAVAAAIAVAVANPASASASAAEVYAWGTLPDGLLETDTPSPVALEGVAAIDASNRSDYALKTDGTVWAWGYNSYGALGDGTTTSSATPVEVDLPVGVQSLGEARSSGMAVGTEGSGWVWGQDGSGDLCVPPEQAILRPVHPAGLTDVVAVQGGETHTMWLTDSGHVLTCGSNDWGSLGVGEAVKKVDEPVEIPGLAHVVEMTAGERQALVRTESGEVYAWGGNEYGQTCTGSTAKTVWTPERVDLPDRAKAISGGGNHPTNGSTLIVLQNGALYGCGYNEDGQADPASSRTNILSATDTGLTFAYAVAGAEESLGLTASGELYAWGSGRKRDLGDGSTKSSRTPVRADTNVATVSATATTVVDLHR